MLHTEDLYTDALIFKVQDNKVAHECGAKGRKKKGKLYVQKDAVFYNLYYNIFSCKLENMHNVFNTDY